MGRNLFFTVVVMLISIAGYSQTPAAYTGWVKKAEYFNAAMQYREAAEAYTLAFASMDGKGSVTDRYNAACSWSLAGNKDSAFFQLNKIATKGNYADYNHLLEDPDLESLHTDGRWKDLCELVKQNKDKAEANLNRPLVAILDTIFQNDQHYRLQVDVVAKKYGQNSTEMHELWKTINMYDSINIIKVVAILDQYGWPGPDTRPLSAPDTVWRCGSITRSPVQCAW